MNFFKTAAAKKYLMVLFFISAFVLVLGCDSGSSSGSDPDQQVAVADNDHMLLGNPSSAVTNATSSPNNYLMVKTQYCLSYNKSKLTTNWTSWHLGSSDIGDTDRQDDFRADTTLPTGWYEVTEDDFQYATYGFDRGHMCPSADRTSSVANNSATFLMTNMIPQASDNNQKTWQNLETYERTLVSAGNELFVISGPLGSGGESGKGTYTSITTVDGLHSITVPAYTWKIVVVLTSGSNDLSRISSSTRVIAVKMPNTNSCDTLTWPEYRVTVRSLESDTGYDFLSNVPQSVQDVLETSVDTAATN